MKPSEGYTIKEKILYRGRMHWIAYTGSLFWFVFGLFIIREGDAGDVAGGIFFLLAIVTAALTFVKIKTASYIVGANSVGIQTGVLYRLNFETPLSKIVDVKVEQSVPGRLFDYGTVVIFGVGETRDAFHRIAAPNKLRREIVDRIPSQ
ncbi:MAG: PH domain-containing protein [Thermodesulfobacteriota bacterium]|nr:PH domain-containing protein [Thermodesulfobacteriota bacterium]